MSSTLNEAVAELGVSALAHVAIACVTAGVAANLATKAYRARMESSCVGG